MTYPRTQSNEKISKIIQGTGQLDGYFGSNYENDNEIVDCGIDSMLPSLLLENSICKSLLRIGIKNHFCYEYKSRDFLLDRYNLGGKKTAQKVSV